MKIASWRGWICLLAVSSMVAQQPPRPVPIPPGFIPGAPPPQQAEPRQEPAQQPAPAQPPAAAPQQMQPGQQAPPQAEAAKPAPQAPQGTQPAQPSMGGLSLQNASLTEVIDFLARQLRINYVLDPKVRGGVTLNTYGEMRDIDPRALLDTILRINGFAMVQTGDIYRIVPLAEVAQLPISPQLDARDIPEDDQSMLNLVFLKYATVEELAKLLDPFIGPGGKTWAYPPANLLLILDSRRSMKRTMELVALFDNDTFASQRVRLFEVKNSRPSDLAEELEGILRSISLSKDSTPIKFLPINRINTLVAVAPNPGAFDEVERWITKLDVAVKSKAGEVDNFVYRVKYGRAEFLAMSIMSLYGGWGMGMMGMMGMGGMGGMGMGGFGGIGMGMGGMGMGGMGMGAGGFGPMGMNGMGAMGMGGFGGMGMGVPMMGMGGNRPIPFQGAPGAGGMAGAGGAGAGGMAGAAGGDATGMYLGPGGMGMGPQVRMPRVVPNPLDNTLLIQATAEEYEGILKLLRDLDVSPRQVLIEAKIYEVSLTGAFSSGVQAYLQRRGQQGSNVPSLSSRMLSAASPGDGLALTAGMLVGQSRELLAMLGAQEDNRRSKVISAPTVMATDSIPAVINVGTEVPTLSATSVAPIQSGGSSVFANTIQNRNAGVTLGITARVNPSGIVTLVIDQEVSAPVPPSASSAIQSPSFSKRNVATQITLQDGDTIAIGGIIQETDTYSSAGVPVLHRVPGIGWAFGSKALSKERTELIIFITPRVIYDTNEIVEASDELKSQMRRVQKLMKD
ncbi:MAG: type II secretion system secretin GspD [Bryobacteraceae bacterium]